MRYVNVETGEIFDAVQIKRFQETQKRLSWQSLPVWKRKRKQQRWSRVTQWCLKLMSHFAPMVILGSIAVALLRH